MNKDKRKDKRKKAAKAYSGIDAHKRQKKVLVPPLMAIPGVRLQSWVDDRLPEMLWPALLIVTLGRESALERFRKLAQLVPALPEAKRIVQPTLSGIASLEEATRKKFLATICGDTEATNTLRPILLFDDLPAKAEWAKSINQKPTAEDWDVVKTAVRQILDHQSQEATDCRWLRVLFQVLSGKFHFPTREHVREILEYPTFGLQEKVRPTIRSLEGMLDQVSNSTSSWPESFWKQCLRDTPCEARHTMETNWSAHVATTRRRIREVREALKRHERLCLKTTDVDARHDSTFGFGAYALAILQELVSMGNGIAILGRIGLRTLFEVYATLLYLRLRDDPALWMAYRQYGSGQAKLAFLKLDDSSSSAPSSINPDILRQLANEDRWLEFVSIDLGHWAATDLRKLSDELGIKADYDRFYPWTSAFTHANWAALRNSCFDLCINPVHRLHRTLRSDTADLGDVVPDACELVDKILSALDSLYPGFAPRVTLSESKSAPTATTATPTASAATQSPTATVQREFFEILDEFFRRATGCSAEDFAPLGSFGDRIRTEAPKLGRRAAQAFLYAYEALGTFYKRFGIHVFSEAKSVGGLKFVLGGSSRFGESQFESVRKMLLYADSILIPDPILPWIESPRAEERFRNVQLLEAAFVLLHLKPVADADLPSPAILVVPSFEKSLEQHDATTQARISLFTTQVLSHFLGHKFDSFDELRDFATTEESAFMGSVDQAKLFVAPGGRVGQPLKEALEQYVGEIEEWRSESFQAAVEELPRGLLLLTGLMERLTPEYHLLENAVELSACPLIPLAAPWHYHSLTSRFFAERLKARTILDADAMAALNLGTDPPRQWLGNIPVNHLVGLRLNGTNEAFRSQLNGQFSLLHHAPLADLNRVAPEVCRGIASLLKEHEKEIQAIREQYESRYGDVWDRRYITTGASYLPTLAPTIDAVDLSPAGEGPHSAQTESPSTGKCSANSLLGALAVGNEE